MLGPRPLTHFQLKHHPCTRVILLLEMNCKCAEVCPLDSSCHYRCFQRMRYLMHLTENPPGKWQVHWIKIEGVRGKGLPRLPWLAPVWGCWGTRAWLCAESVCWPGCLTSLAWQALLCTPGMAASPSGPFTSSEDLMPLFLPQFLFKSAASF